MVGGGGVSDLRTVSGGLEERSKGELVQDLLIPYIAVMGCVVNGPGEALPADPGLPAEKRIDL